MKKASKEKPTSHLNQFLSNGGLQKHELDSMFDALVRDTFENEGNNNHAYTHKRVQSSHHASRFDEFVQKLEAEKSKTPTKEAEFTKHFAGSMKRSVTPTNNPLLNAYLVTEGSIVQTHEKRAENSVAGSISVADLITQHNEKLNRERIFRMVRTERSSGPGKRDGDEGMSHFSPEKIETVHTEGDFTPRALKTERGYTLESERSPFRGKEYRIEAQPGDHSRRETRETEGNYPVSTTYEFELMTMNLELQTKIVTLNREITSLSSSLDEERDRIRSLQADLEQSETKSREKEEKISEIQEKYEKELLVVRAERDNLRKELDDTLNRMLEIETNLQENSFLKREHESLGLRDRSRFLSDMSDDAELRRFGVNEPRKAEEYIAHKRIKELEKELWMEKEITAKMQNRINVMSSEIAAQNNEVLQAFIREGKIKEENLKNDLKKFLLELQNKIKENTTLKAEIEALNSKNQALETKNEELTYKNQELQDDIQKLKELISKMQNEVRQFEQAVKKRDETLQGEIGAKKNEIEKLKEEVQQLTEEKKVLEDNIVDYIAESDREKEILYKEKTAALKKSQSMADEIMRSKNLLARADEINEQLQIKIAECEQKLEEEQREKERMTESHLKELRNTKTIPLKLDGLKNKLKDFIDVQLALFSYVESVESHLTGDKDRLIKQGKLVNNRLREEISGLENEIIILENYQLDTQVLKEPVQSREKSFTFSEEAQKKIIESPTLMGLVQGLAASEPGNKRIFADIFSNIQEAGEKLRETKEEKAQRLKNEKKVLKLKEELSRAKLELEKYQEADSSSPQKQAAEQNVKRIEDELKLLTTPENTDQNSENTPVIEPDNPQITTGVGETIEKTPSKIETTKIESELNTIPEENEEESMRKSEARAEPVVGEVQTAEPQENILQVEEVKNPEPQEKILQEEEPQKEVLQMKESKNSETLENTIQVEEMKTPEEPHQITDEAKTIDTQAGLADKHEEQANPDIEIANPDTEITKKYVGPEINSLEMRNQKLLEDNSDLEKKELETEKKNSRSEKVREDLYYEGFSLGEV